MLGGGFRKNIFYSYFLMLFDIVPNNIIVWIWLKDLADLSKKAMARRKKAGILDRKPWLMSYYYPATGSRYEALRYDEK